MADNGTSPKGLTSLEALAVAIRKEIEARRFYERFAEAVSNPLVVSRIRGLAEEERRHEEILTRIYERDAGEPPVVPDERSAEVEPPPSATFTELLDTAVVREEDAIALYTDAAERAHDQRTKFVFVYLASMERGHRAVLLAEKENLRNDPKWFETDLGEGLTFIGP